MMMMMMRMRMQMMGMKMRGGWDDAAPHDCLKDGLRFALARSVIPWLCTLHPLNTFSPSKWTQDGKGDVSLI